MAVRATPWGRNGGDFEIFHRRLLHCCNNSTSGTRTATEVTDAWVKHENCATDYGHNNGHSQRRVQRAWAEGTRSAATRQRRWRAAGDWLTATWEEKARERVALRGGLVDWAAPAIKPEPLEPQPDEYGPATSPKCAVGRPRNFTPWHNLHRPNPLLFSSLCQRPLWHRGRTQAI